MKKLALLFSLVILSSTAFAQGSTAGGNVNFFLGSKQLNEGDWGIWADQGEFGVLVDIQMPNTPVSFAVDVLGSSEEHYGWLVSTSEIDLGARMHFDVQGTPLHPYVGGGLGLMSLQVEDTWFGGSDQDTGLGFWLNGGVYATLGEHFNLGLDLRYSSADVTVVGASTNAGGSHVGLLLGYHW